MLTQANGKNGSTPNMIAKSAMYVDFSLVLVRKRIPSPVLLSSQVEYDLEVSGFSQLTGCRPPSTFLVSAGYCTGFFSYSLKNIL